MLSIGLMSGTSMDGIDAALIKTDGLHHIEEIADISLPYDALFRILLKAAEYAVREAHGQFPTENGFYERSLPAFLQHELQLNAQDTVEKMKALSQYFHGHDNLPITFQQIVQRSTELHAETVNQLLKKVQLTSHDIDVIGYHGQTLFHRPSAKLTIQVGDGNWLAEKIGITVVNDFRRQDVLNGGQGAPFAPLYHQALAARDANIPVVLVNCGGIANVSVITGSDPNHVLGFDTGPGNVLIDRYIRQKTHGRELMDTDGHYGLQGNVNESVLTLLYSHSLTSNVMGYFSLTPPKSLDVADFQLIPELDNLSLADACATLEAFTADTIAQSTQFFNTAVPDTWVLVGGGWHNPVIRRELMARLNRRLGKVMNVITAAEIGWNASAMEAQIFAYLAVRSLKNLPISFPNITCVTTPLCGGYSHVPTQGTTRAVATLLQDK